MRTVSEGSVSDKYKLGAKIGHGHFGVVRMATHRESGESYACKIIPKQGYSGGSVQSGEIPARLQREIDIGLELGGEARGVVSIVEAYSDEQRVYLIMELAGGGTLAEYIDLRRQAWQQQLQAAREHNGQTKSVHTELERLRSERRERKEVEAGWMLAELASSLAHCHDSGILHRDLKPENVLLSQPVKFGEWASGLPRVTSAASQETQRKEGRSLWKKLKGSLISSKVAPAAEESSPAKRQDVMIADFGLAERLAPGEAAEVGFVGSPAYVPPEVVQGSSSVGFAADVWGLGIILFFLLSDGRLPFCGRSTAMLLRSIKHAQLDLSSPSLLGVSSEAKDVLRALLSADPALRPSAVEVAQLPWVQQQCQKWAKLTAHAQH